MNTKCVLAAIFNVPMLSVRVSLLSATFAAVLVVVTGCGTKAPSLETGTLSGTVTYKDLPVEGAALTFHPTSTGKTCQAETDAQGKFTVTTSLPGGEEVPGAVPGEYAVTITKLVVPEGSTEMTAPKHQLPKKYVTAKKSGLTATVKLGDANEATFVLKD